MKKLIWACACLVSSMAYGQVMPSPNASSMIRSVNTPVNLYNGTKSVSIPLYEAKADNGATVPVALQYTGGGGIRVAEVPGVAGLGWNLQAGGSITRVMRGQPDEHKRYTTSIKEHTVKNYLENKRFNDFEKDLFFFSIPNGSGRFIFSGDFKTWVQELVVAYTGQECTDRMISCYDDVVDAVINGFGGVPNCDNVCETSRLHASGGEVSFNQVVTLPASDVNIVFVYRGYYDSHFIITDTQGIKYYFGQTANSREVTTTNFKDNLQNNEYKDENETKFISTWHLNRIVYPDQPSSKDIRFDYVESTITDVQESYRMPFDNRNPYYLCIKSCKTDEECNDCIQYNNHTHGNKPPRGGNWVHSPNYNASFAFFNNKSTFRSTITTKYLSNIRFPKGKISFGYTGRQDVNNGKALQSITLRDHSNRIVSNVTLNQTYFSASDSYYKGEKRGWANGNKGRRLKLESIEQNGLVMHAFDYANDKTFDSKGIDAYELPPRDSYYTDHWGFYNGGSHQGKIYTWHPEYTNQSIRGMKKRSWKYAKANILTKITNALGGYKTFEYENHPNHGGVRVTNVRDHDKNGRVISSIEYDYFGENPEAIRKPSYTERVAVTAYQPGQWNEIQGVSTVNLFQSSPSFVFDLNGTRYGYGKVIEGDSVTGARVEHEFRNHAQRPLTFDEKYLFTGDLVKGGARKVPSREFDEMAYPFVTGNLEFFDTGIELKTSTYDRTGKIASQQENVYKHGARHYLTTNHSMHQDEWDTDDGNPGSHSYELIVSPYKISTRNIYLDHSINRTYDDAGNLVSTYRTDYDYSHDYKTIPTQVTTTRIQGQGDFVNSKRTTIYPFNTESWHGRRRSSMLNANAIGIPVAEIQEINPSNDGKGWLIANASYTTFSGFRPIRNHALILDEPKAVNLSTARFKQLSEVQYYNDGLIRSRKGTDGVTTHYTYDDAGYVKTVMTDPGISSLRRTTQYEHYPLIGLKSVTDPNGRKVTYEYDDRNRLLLTRDDDGNIRKRYRYHYADEEINGFNPSIQVGYGYNRTCTTISFTAKGVDHLYGENTYTWSFGDSGNAPTCSGNSSGPTPGGSHFNGNGGAVDYTPSPIGRNSVSHRFTAPGTYNVRLKVFNPELGIEKVSTKNITIRDGLPLPTIFGPDEVTDCRQSGGGPGNGGIGFMEVQETMAPGVVAISQHSYHTEEAYDNQQHPYVHLNIGFSGQGPRCQGGTRSGSLEYRVSNGSWIPFGSNGIGELPSSAFNHSSRPYTILVRGEVRDRCSNTTYTATHSVRVNPCNNNRRGNGGNTSGGSTGEGGNPGGRSGNEQLAPIERARDSSFDQ